MFIGTKEADKIESGLITYKDGTTEKYSEEWANYLASETEEDYQNFLFKKISKVAGDFLKHMKDGRFSLYEQNEVLKTMRMSLDKASEDAICHAFGVKHKEEIPFDKVSEFSLKFNSQTND